MLEPRSSNIVEIPTEDGFWRRPIAWVPLLFISIVVYGGFSEDFLNLAWAGISVNSAADILPSIETWARKSFFPEITRLIFVWAWLSIAFYAALIAGWAPYREMFLKSLVGRRRHLAVLPVVTMMGIGVFLLTVTFPEEPNCTRKCIYEAPWIQVLYSSGGAFLTGYGLAMLYWWITHFSTIHFARATR
ncbi:hypothetical protein BK649_03135 [Pseudomonas canadensis]|uniref:Uncharacterized protein n=1 Tax=Pseudomonas canadensis TaxID=915099 RepID=A0A423FEH7_9PSED|nr:hypothetical protein [Pseudomonas canadensis]ROM55966.1 hypothetical protein BK649_03135 [Pseudomonas canadensis]